LEDVDGYYYIEGNLYFCPKSKQGLCELEENIKNGYYINYNSGPDKLCYSTEYYDNEKTEMPKSTKNGDCGPNKGKLCGEGLWCCKNEVCHEKSKLKSLKDHFPCNSAYGGCPCLSTVYRCEKNKDGIMECTIMDASNTCENSSINVDIVEIEGQSNEYENTVQVCGGIKKGAIDTLNNLKNLKEKSMYSLKKVEDFPGSESDANYIRVEVSKYSVKFIDDIKYTEENMGYNCKVKIGGNGNKSCEETKIKYPIESNNGYWEYDESSKSYKRIVIPDGNGKYDCEVDGLCIYKDLDKISPVDSLLKNGVLYIRYSDGKKSPANNIKEGTIYYSKNGWNKLNWILCKGDGICSFKSEREINVGGKTLGYYNNKDKEGIKLTIGSSATKVEVESSINFSKYVFKPSSGNDGEVIELTNISYTPVDDTRNIFVYKGNDNDNSYRMITNENLDIGEGYFCNKGKCIKINREGYYLNTAQLGNKLEPGYHELVKCSKNGNTIKCDFVVIEGEGMTYENAVAAGAEDAVILCSKSSGCQTGMVSEVKGLLRCKEIAETGDLFKDEENSNYYENGMKLSDDQYCIYKDVIYGKKEDKKAEIPSGIYMFDFTSRKIEHKEVREDHLYASLYYCNKSKCLRTLVIL